MALYCHGILHMTYFIYHTRYNIRNIQCIFDEVGLLEGYFYKEIWVSFCNSYCVLLTQCFEYNIS